MAKGDGRGNSWLWETWWDDWDGTRKTKRAKCCVKRKVLKGQPTPAGVTTYPFTQVEYKPDGTTVIYSTDYTIWCEKKNCKSDCSPPIQITYRLPNKNYMTDFKCRCPKCP